MSPEEDPVFRTGRVSFGGIVKTVQLAYTPEAAPGDYVLVHVGFALAIIDEEEARRTLALLEREDAAPEPPPQPATMSQPAPS